MHNAKLGVDDACLASLAKLPDLQILGLGNFQVRPAGLLYQLLQYDLYTAA